jgi:hypothetical protein
MPRLTRYPVGQLLIYTTETPRLAPVGPRLSNEWQHMWGGRPPEVWYTLGTFERSWTDFVRSRNAPEAGSFSDRWARGNDGSFRWGEW